MKVLHITSWYPHRETHKEALFIQRQIAALGEVDEIDQKVIHLNVCPGRTQFLKWKENGIAHYLLKIPTNRWFIIELISIFLLSLCLVRHRANSYDIVNFHIAYPNLTFWHWIKRLVKPRVVITEHWSAYHFNFGLQEPPFRVQRIFQQQIPVIAVSNALLNDIRLFSKADFRGFVVPNVVDTSIFRQNTNVKREKCRFFMVAHWKKPKEPMVVISAFKLFLESNNNAELIIGGYGPMLDEMKRLVSDLQISRSVKFVGKMEPTDVAIEMQKASAYIHCSEYETFSVVCAEALSCGCPVIASNVGGIPEFANERNGVLVSKNDPGVFHDALNTVTLNTFIFEKMDFFSPNQVGKQYANVLNEISR